MAAAQVEQFRERWQAGISRAGAPVCVGLDPDPSRIPSHLGSGPEGCRVFLKGIIEATRDLVAAFKANTAFFEAYGADGWAVLEQLRSWIGPDVLLIADAKRGDIEHTNEAYARALFKRVRADAVTVQPYLGGQALAPFCHDARRGMFVLCVTSNAGAETVQEIETAHGPLYLEIAKQARTFSEHDNVGLVVGTTKPEALDAVLGVASDLPLLLPGGGVQGGDTKRVIASLRRAGASGLFTFSRSVIYASQGRDFAEAARGEVERLRKSFVHT